MGSYQFKYILDNIDILGPHFQKEYGIDLKDKIENTEPSYIDYHQMVTVPLNGYKDGFEYVRKCAPYYRIPDIQRPTMFLNAVNDPFMGEKVIDYDVFKSNKNAVLATNKYAGHMGYHENVFSMDMWFVGPCMDFLDGLRKR